MMVKSLLWGRVKIVIVVIAVLLAFYYLKLDFLQQLEFKLIDAKFGLRSPIKPESGITIIGIDNMIHSRYLTESPEAIAITVALLIVFPVVLGLILPRSGKTVLGFLIAVMFILGFLVFNFYFFTVKNVQSNTIYPLLAISFTYLWISMHTSIIHEHRAARLRKSVFEMGFAISSVLDISELLPKILDSMIKAVGASRGMLLSCVADKEVKQELSIECQQNMPVTIVDSEKFSYGKKIISEVRSTRRAIIINNLRRAKNLPLVITEGDFRLPYSLLCLPMKHRKGPLRIIYMEAEHHASNLWDEDLKIVDSLITQAAIAIDNALMYSTVRQAEEKLREENIYLKQEVKENKLSSYIIGESKAIEECLKLVTKAADTDITVLIEGETGTGKELVARAIHFTGKRKTSLFVAQNCSALPESLLESELFGHKKGTFTGAVEDRKGLFEIATGGTIFLDEIADMTPALQAKLLRVLQEGMIRPVGGVKEKKVDLRIISATNKNLAEEVKAGRFREDLYYRLHVFAIHVPPLRKRREDIPILAMHFIEYMSKRLNKSIKGISREAMTMLMAYDFPGNVRELENEIEKAVVMASSGEMITTDNLSDKMESSASPYLPKELPVEEMTLRETLTAVEKELIMRALNKCGGNKTKAAEELGISRKGLAKMLARLNLKL